MDIEKASNRACEFITRAEGAIQETLEWREAAVSAIAWQFADMSGDVEAAEVLTWDVCGERRADEALQAEIGRAHV